MATGKVKWFNNAKGYGFILSENGGDDLFVHYSSIQMEGYKTLKAGQTVEFDIQKGPKGFHAVNIRGGVADIDDSLLDHPTPSDRLEAERGSERVPERDPERDRETRAERTSHPHTVLESG
jgi:CspA family cold shock protein